MKPFLLGVTVAAAFIACARNEGEDPGRRGLAAERAELTPADQAAAYATALRAAFDLPATTLLIDPRMLPSQGGYDETDARMDEAVARALIATRAVSGECVPSGGTVNRAPACDVRNPGYAVRFSELFQSPGDTLRLYLVAERYRPTVDTLTYHSPFRMEERYHLARTAGRWQVARKARMML